MKNRYLPVLLLPVAVLTMGLAARSAAAALSLPLTTGASNKLDAGAFPGGALLTITSSGQGDLVNSSYQTNPDGSLAAVATGNYTFANFGATYPIINGGDGINHFVNGGATYDFSGSGYPFAGPQTTDTTNPADIRFGSVVGTFSAAPGRADWFNLGESGTITVPAGGSELYLAVNDTDNDDNHGTYSVNIAVSTPEPMTAGLLGVPALLLLAARRRV